MPEAKDGLVLEYVPCAGGARLVRLYGDTPCPVLPEIIAGLPLAELGAYCFAETQRESELPLQSACRWARLSPGESGAVPCAPVSGAHRIGGSFVQCISLPEALKTIGNCAFYNCRRLEALSVGPGIEAYGSDVFLNTFLLRRIEVRSSADAPGSLFRLVNGLSTDIEALFMPDGETVQAAAFYPEYWEDIEETPAHILLHTYSGQGYHYRQCFLEGAPHWAEYDAVFPMARAEDPPAAMALLALGRLRWPWELLPEAEAQYRAFLSEHGREAVAALQKRQDTAGLSALLALGVLDASVLEDGAAAAAKADNAEFAALLTNALHTRQAAASAEKASRYSFDF
jgi:hypothetical protein